MDKENKYKIYWDKNRKTPIIINEHRNESALYGKDLLYMATDLRPVFVEEKYLLTKLFPDNKKNMLLASVWADKLGSYYIDGLKLKKSVLQATKKVDINNIRNALKAFSPSSESIEFENDVINRFIKVNSSHFKDLLYSQEKDKEGYPIGAEPFIVNTVEKNPKRTVFVSFSGGKDSTVVSHLVTKALNQPSVIHIFGDTTLEFPETYEYIKKFMDKNSKTPFFIEKNETSDFMELCHKVGPPSRVKSWCCSIFKTGPIGTTLSEMDVNLLTFLGIRRHESASRSKYARISISPKIKKQKVASPVIDWLDIDIWLYIFTEKLDFNISYRRGFTRVGCWCCPNNSAWSDFLSSVYNVDSYDSWNNFLINFARKIGKLDAETYIRDGKWKARQGGDGLENSSTKINSKECTNENNAKSFQLTRKIDDEFYELFKPFGNLDFDIGKKALGEVYILGKNNEMLFKITGKKGDKQVRIAVLADLSKVYPILGINNNIFNYIVRQIRKFQACIYCKACNSVCPVSAIKVTDSSYEIDSSKCTHCLKCVMHFYTGCLIASALATKD